MIQMIKMKRFSDSKLWSDPGVNDPISIKIYLCPPNWHRNQSLRFFKITLLRWRLFFNFFLLTELILSINRKTLHDDTNVYDKFLVFSLNQLKLTVVQKTFNLDATVRLGAVNLQHHRAGCKIINMIETPEVEAKEAVANQYLFAVTYSNVSKVEVK